MTTLAELLHQTAGIAPALSREDRMAQHRARIARTQAPHPIVMTPSAAEVDTKAKRIAEALLQNPAVRKSLKAAGFKLPPITASVSTAPFTLPSAQTRGVGPSAVVRSPFTQKEAREALNAMIEDVRSEGGRPTIMQAFAIACERRPDLAEAAGIAGAGLGTLNAWTAGEGRSHAEGCECAGMGTCAGWQGA